mgnify:FL=1
MRRIIDADKLREIAVHEEVCRRLAEKRHQRAIIDAEERQNV